MYIFTYMCTYVYIPTSKNSGPRPWCHSPHFFLLNLKYMYRLYNVHLNPYNVHLHTCTCACIRYFLVDFLPVSSPRLQDIRQFTLGACDPVIAVGTGGAGR